MTWTSVIGFLPRASAWRWRRSPAAWLPVRDDLPWPGARTPPQMPARTRARAGPTPACRPRPRARAPSVRTALGRGSVRSRRRRSGARGAISPPRPGSSTSRRTIVPVSSTRTTIAPSDAPLWHTPLVTSSDTTSSASSSTNAGTRPRRRPTTIRAAPGARASSGRRTSSAPPSRAAPSPPWRPHPFVGGPQLGVLRLQRRGPAAQVRRHRAELLDHARLAPTGQAQAVKLRTRTD